MDKLNSTDPDNSSSIPNTVPRPDIGDRSYLSDFEKLMFDDLDDCSDDLDAWSRYWSLFFHPELQSRLSREELEKLAPKLERCRVLYPQKERQNCIRFNAELYRAALEDRSSLAGKMGTEPMAGVYCKVIVPAFPEQELPWWVGDSLHDESQHIVQRRQYFLEQTDEKQPYQITLTKKDVEELEKWKQSKQPLQK